MSDDLTTAYMLGVEHMRDKLHKQAKGIERLQEAADGVERLLADIERQEKIIAELKQENERLRQSYIPFAEKHNELRNAVKQLFQDRTHKTFAQNLAALERYLEHD